MIYYHAFLLVHWFYNYFPILSLTLNNKQTTTPQKNCQMTMWYQVKHDSSVHFYKIC